MDRRTDQISDSIIALSGLSRPARREEPRDRRLDDGRGPGDGRPRAADQPGSPTHRPGRRHHRHALQVPVPNGTDTSGRSVIADLNTVSGAFNDVATDPNVSLSALNGLMPMVIKGTSGTSDCALRRDLRLIPGHIPDIGFAGDSGFHGPEVVHLQPDHRVVQVHAVPPAGAGRGPRAGRAAGPGDPEPDRPGPVAGQRAAARPGPRPVSSSSPPVRRRAPCRRPAARAGRGCTRRRPTP